MHHHVIIKSFLYFMLLLVNVCIYALQQKFYDVLEIMGLMMQTIFGGLENFLLSSSFQQPSLCPSLCPFLLLQYIVLLFIIISPKLTMTTEFASNDKIYIKSHTQISNPKSLFCTLMLLLHFKRNKVKFNYVRHF